MPGRWNSYGQNMPSAFKKILDAIDKGASILTFFLLKVVLPPESTFKCFSLVPLFMALTSRVGGVFMETKFENLSKVPLWERFLLTVKEASDYFNIGENKMYRIVNEYIDSEYKFVVQNGNRVMINRKKFEDFLNKTSSI